MEDPLVLGRNHATPPVPKVDAGATSIELYNTPRFPLAPFLLLLTYITIFTLFRLCFLNLIVDIFVPFKFYASVCVCYI